MKRNKGFAGMSYEQIMMQQSIKQINEPVYCRYCGKDIKTTYTSKEEKPWELKYSAHTKCHQEHLMKERGFR